MPFDLSRRDFVLSTAAVAAAAPPDLETEALARNEESVRSLLRVQITDPKSRWRGGYPSEFGIQEAGSAGGILHTFMAAFLDPRSKFYQNNLLVERMRLAAGYLERSQSPEGLISLLITNFNSPPDTGFVVHGVAAAACLAQRSGERGLAGMLAPFLRKAGAGMAVGGVHTPNHRWVICEALAQIHEILPDPAYLRRIDQWLAEGMDIDEEGQYTERSSSIYNSVVNRALSVMAVKLKRPELLDPVRRNLNAMLYLLHPDYDVVTEISGRQDKDQRGDLSRYWFPLRLVAVRDGNGQLATLAEHFRAHASLGELIEYPELLKPGPALQPVPENYEKIYPVNGYARIRRGPLSATLLMRESSKLAAFRYGNAVINGIRMASSFFGKGQFVPTLVAKRGDSYRFEQTIEGGYLQPFEPPRKITTKTWYRTRLERRLTEICRLHYSADITERKNGLEVRFRAEGTADVPLAVEISFREDGKLEGCVPAPAVPGAYLLPSGYGVYRAGGNAIHFGPGARAHTWTELRRVEPKLSGQSVYLTGLAPFDHTLTFTWV